MVALVAGLGLMIPGASNAEPTWTPNEKKKATKVVVKKSKVVQKASPCLGHVAGLIFYRNRYLHHSLQMGDVKVDFTRPKNCVRAAYLANRWQKRAYKMRVKLERWQAKQRRLEARRLANRHPSEIALDLLGGDRVQWNCLMDIVSHENRAMDPTLDFGGGHGNVYEAYGIPQANPGYKMRSHGSDWATNPETQLRWMIDYCRQRYGSVCGAAAHRNANGSY
jgi:hypothetical protein